MVGVAIAATFYQPAFAALTHWWGPDRVHALTTVTLAGGLASTVLSPLTATLADRLSWRTTCTALTVILAAVTIPAHALALRAPGRLPRQPNARPAPRRSPAPAPGRGHRLVDERRHRRVLRRAAGLRHSPPSTLPYVVWY
ncbi:MFS transporter [Streptomyces sp. NPDC055681]